MTFQDWLKEQREIESKATLAPWYVEGSEVRHDFDPMATDDGIADCSVQVCDLYMISKELDSRHGDRKFIAESRNNYRNMLDALEIAVKALSTITLTENDAADVYVNYRRDVTLKQIKENLGVT